MKTYGAIHFDKKEKQWVITEAKPHICIKLKNIFPKLSKTGTVPFKFRDSPETCSDLNWFLIRYKMVISKQDNNRLVYGDTVHVDTINKLETIFLPSYVPNELKLKNDFTARSYQLKANELLLNHKRFLLGDDLGLGKTLSGILGFTNPGALPAAVVCDANLTRHWEGQIKKFTDLRTHVIKTRSAYNLPKDIDVFIFTYSKLSGWVDIFNECYFKYALFDEVQEMRTGYVSQKYCAAIKLSWNAQYAMGMSATPIYNNAIEIHNILHLLKENCLDKASDFIREWCGSIFSVRVTDPPALGAYLREQFLFLRRTREEVKMELPRINTIIQEVDYDQEEVDKEEEMLRSLAVAITSGSFTERGTATREFDLRMRQITGIAKAKFVAQYVKMILMNDEPVLLGGWHRAVYDIWLEELKEFNPVMYTGTESPKEKAEAQRKFESGETNLMIISLRSAKGIDGLQKRCSIAVHGELDWVPEVHKQFVGRVDRDGQETRVTSIYMIADGGSDPQMVEVHGLKSSQAHGIINPFSPISEQFTDDSRVKIMAEKLLQKLEHKHKKIA